MKKTKFESYFKSKLSYCNIYNKSKLDIFILLFYF